MRFFDLDWRAPEPALARNRALRLLRPRWSFRARMLFLELVHLPVYAVKVTMAEAGGGLHLAVDAVTGRVERLAPALCRDLDPAGAPQLLPPRLDPAAACRLALEETPWMGLGAALRSGRSFRLERAEVETALAYPYWVLHIRRGSRREFRAADALTGVKAGPDRMRALALGFTRACGCANRSGDRAAQGR